MDEEEVKRRLRFNANRLRSEKMPLKKKTMEDIDEAKDSENQRVVDSQDDEVNLLRAQKRAKLLQLLNKARND